jgi:hypothetical protein
MVVPVASGFGAISASRLCMLLIELSCVGSGPGPEPLGTLDFLIYIVIHRADQFNHWLSS